MLDFPSPPASAYAARPSTVEEIDTHPDSARIWALILSLRDAAERQLGAAEAEAVREREHAFDSGFTEGYRAREKEE